MGSNTDQIGRDARYTGLPWALALIAQEQALSDDERQTCQLASDELERLRAERDEAVSALPQAVRNERERCIYLANSAMAFAKDADWEKADLLLSSLGAPTTTTGA